MLVCTCTRDNLFWMLIVYPPDDLCLHSVCSSCLSPLLSLCAARRITMVVLSVRSCDVRERYVIVLKWGSLGVTNICTHANICLCVRVCQADRIRDEVIWRSETIHFCEPKAHWGCQELAVQTPAAWWLHHICGETLSQRHEGNYLSLSTDILDGGYLVSSHELLATYGSAGGWG